MKSSKRQSRVKPCAAAIALALASSIAWPGPSACAATVDHAEFQPAAIIAVTNCNDGGPGSLRAAVAIAVSGDELDLHNLGCSTISLTTGQIEIPQNDLYLKYSGNGSMPLTIDANYSSRVFHHTGSGTLRVTGMTLTHGKYDNTNAQHPGESNGGCIYSIGSVYLLETTVDHCVAKDTTGNNAHGGGIYAYGSLTLMSSVVSGNAANSQGGRSSGGGAHSRGAITMEYSSISGNSTQADTQLSSRAGGISIQYYGAAPSLILNSTINNNTADRAGGIDFSAGGTNGDTLTIRSSTISGNVARYAEGAAGSLFGQIAIQNSTIAFNQSDDGPALLINQTNKLFLVNFESSIFFGNHAGAIEYDVGSQGWPFTITGANNIVGGYPDILVLPTDTLSVDPQLQPLADNGGPTRTHALGSGSPAIDAGNNAAALTVDQRGAGYPRVVGARADIGAMERQTPDDTIFVDGFD